MKRTVIHLSLALVFVLTAIAAASSAQQPEKLSTRQLASLIAAAKTPAEHSRIAQYYAAQAQSDLAQAAEHEQMAAHYRQSSMASSSKFAAGTVNHCEYLVRHLNREAVKLQGLAQQHEEMAKAAQK